MKGYVLLAALLAVACSGPTPSEPDRDGKAADAAPVPSQDSPSPAGGPGVTNPNRRDRTRTILVEYMVKRRVRDEAAAGFGDLVEATLIDKRGWERAGFSIVRKPQAKFRVVLAEGQVVDDLCFPYETRGLYSCQNGPVVALNADRWRFATPQWTGTLAAYRKMLVNHEFGHLLGQHHPKVQCPDPGRPAPVMAQQSTELNGCLPNPWPLPHEIARAARHDLPLAPPYEG